MFRQDKRKGGKGIVINTMPATGLSISYTINGITMSMYRNTRSGMDTAADVAIGTTIKAIVDKVKVMAGTKAKITTETKHDQINLCCITQASRNSSLLPIFVSELTM
jgi:hypothetical protein